MTYVRQLRCCDLNFPGHLMTLKLSYLMLLLVLFSFLLFSSLLFLFSFFIFSLFLFSFFWYICVSFFIWYFCFLFLCFWFCDLIFSWFSIWKCLLFRWFQSFKVIAKYGKPDVLWTEFTSASGICRSKRRTQIFSYLNYSPNHRPLIAQLFTSNPFDMYKVTLLLLSPLSSSSLLLLSPSPSLFLSSSQSHLMFLLWKSLLQTHSSFSFSLSISTFLFFFFSFSFSWF